MTHVLKPKKDVNKLTHTILKVQRDSKKSPAGSSLPSVLNSRFTSEYSQSLCGALQCSSMLCGAPDSGAQAHAACWWHPNLQRWYWGCENSSHTSRLLLGTPTPLHLPSHGLSIGPFNNSIICNNPMCIHVLTQFILSAKGRPSGFPYMWMLCPPPKPHFSILLICWILWHIR